LKLKGFAKAQLAYEVFGLAEDSQAREVVIEDKEKGLLIRYDKNKISQKRSKSCCRSDCIREHGFAQITRINTDLLVASIGPPNSDLAAVEAASCSLFHKRPEDASTLVNVEAASCSLPKRPEDASTLVNVEAASCSLPKRPEDALLGNTEIATQCLLTSQGTKP
jgi:hypothetical protein